MTTKTPLIIPISDPEIGFGFLPGARGPLFRLEEDWDFQFWDGCVYHCLTIPAMYEFDKASIPSFFWGLPFNYLPDGLCTVPALEHDFLCDLYYGGSDWLREKIGPLLKVETKFVHAHFYHRLREYGVRPTKAKIMWQGVRKFGPGSWLRLHTWTHK